MTKFPGVVIGLVIDTNDPEGEGRVQLEFPWMPGSLHSSCGGQLPLPWPAHRAASSIRRRSAMKPSSRSSTATSITRSSSASYGTASTSRPSPIVRSE